MKVCAMTRAGIASRVHCRCAGVLESKNVRRGGGHAPKVNTSMEPQRKRALEKDEKAEGRRTRGSARGHQSDEDATQTMLANGAAQTPTSTHSSTRTTNRRENESRSRSSVSRRDSGVQGNGGACAPRRYQRQRDANRPGARTHRHNDHHHHHQQQQQQQEQEQEQEDAR